MVQIFHGSKGWDHRGVIIIEMANMCSKYMIDI